MTTLEQALNTVSQLPIEQQQMLIQIMQNKQYHLFIEKN